MKEYIGFTIFIIIVSFLVFGFIYNYSHDSNTTSDDCIPDYMTGDCDF